MIVKVCGITNRDDAATAVEFGATAIGFNFYRRSPRYIAPESAAAISLPAGVRRVGVFVNQSRARVEEIARIALLDVAQLHGEEMPGDFPAGISVWKALRVVPGFDFAQLEQYPGEATLLDGPAAELYGGSGKSFDWELAAKSRRRIIVAGGLDASNVAQAVAMAHPWGVDACSRIESEPGRKDRKKMKEYLEAARTALGL
jgi:phosphoribosylanthranilate isomerase